MYYPAWICDLPAKSANLDGYSCRLESHAQPPILHTHFLNHPCGMWEVAWCNTSQAWKREDSHHSYQLTFFDCHCTKSNESIILWSRSNLSTTPTLISNEILLFEQDSMILSAVLGSALVVAILSALAASSLTEHRKVLHEISNFGDKRAERHLIYHLRMVTLRRVLFPLTFLCCLLMCIVNCNDDEDEDLEKIKRLCAGKTINVVRVGDLRPFKKLQDALGVIKPTTVQLSPQIIFISHKWYHDQPDDPRDSLLRKIKDLKDNDLFWLDYLCVDQANVRIDDIADVICVLPLLGFMVHSLDPDLYAESAWCRLESIAHNEVKYIELQKARDKVTLRNSADAPILRRCICELAMRKKYSEALDFVMLVSPILRTLKALTLNDDLRVHVL